MRTEISIPGHTRMHTHTGTLYKLLLYFTVILAIHDNFKASYHNNYRFTFISRNSLLSPFSKNKVLENESHYSSHIVQFYNFIFLGITNLIKRNAR